MAKKRSTRQAGPTQPACQCGRVTVESVAADLFVGAYPTKGGYKAEHIAEQVIEAAEEFMKQLAHR